MPDTGGTSDLIRAAGTVLWRGGPREPEVALVHRPKYDDWSFPKGKLKNGEHVLTAALREAEEETGAAVRLGRRLPTTTYLKDGRPKRVDYWSATTPDGAAAFEPNDEVDQVVWRPVGEAAELLSYARDVDLLHEFTGGPLTTCPLIVLRHASAGEKREWRGDDALRPLDARGRAEARALARLLGAFGPVQLISSATARCVETLLPYGLATGTEITTDQAFTVGATGHDRACGRLAELVAGGRPAVICTHGEIVADLITDLCRRLGEKIPDDPALRKSSFWVAHLAAGLTVAIAALERHATR